MKILVISQYYYPEPFKVHEICEELVKRNNKVTVITGMPNYPDGILYKGYKHKKKENINGVEVIRTATPVRGKNPISLIRNYLNFPKHAIHAIKQLNDEYDVVYVYQLSPVFMIKPALYYKNLLQKKVIVYCLDLWPESLNAIHVQKGNLIYKYILKISNRLYSKCDHIFVTSPSFIEYLNRVNNIDKNKISVNYQHGENIFLKIPLYEDTEMLNITFAGNIGKMQGLSYLVNAVELIPSELARNLKITLIGSGSYLEELKELVKKKKMEQIFKFVGRKAIDELIPYFIDTSLFFLSLEKDSDISKTIPSKMQTYLAAGRGIIGTIDGPSNEIVNNEQLGEVCDAGDYKALSKIIIKYLDDNEKIKIRQFSLSSREFFKKNFSLNKHVNNLVKKMEEIQ